MRILTILLITLVGLGANAQVNTPLQPEGTEKIFSPQSRNFNPQLQSYNSQRTYDILFHQAMVERQRGHQDAAFDLLMRCVEIDSTASEAYYFLAQYYTALRQTDKAMAYIERAARLEPQNMTYLETLAHGYIGTERYAEATDVIERMYEADKSRQELLQTLYRLYTQQERLQEAVGVVDRMEQIDGKSERTALAKSGLYVQMDESQRAVDEMKLLSEQHPHDMRYRTLYASALMMNGERDEAADLLTEVLAEEPNNTQAQLALRNYYIGEEDSAHIDSLTHCFLLNPTATTEEKAYQLRSLISESEQADGDSTRILAYFAEMLRQSPPDPDIAELRAAYMELKKMPKDSVEHAFEYVLQIAPDRASSRLRLVQMAWERQDDSRIVELCQAARQYNPEEMGFYYFQGMAYYRQNDTDRALEAFQNGISVIGDDSSPEIVSDFYAVMGDLLFQKNRQQEAFAAYDSCLQWKPDNIGCLNNYAYYLSLNNQRLDEAEQMSFKAIKAEPKNATYLDTYAWILFMQGRYAEARIYIDQALQCDSTVEATITEHAGDIYALCGDIDGAVLFWQSALLENPTNKVLARKVKRRKYIKP